MHRHCRVWGHCPFAGPNPSQLSCINIFSSGIDGSLLQQIMTLCLLTNATKGWLFSGGVPWERWPSASLDRVWYQRLMWYILEAVCEGVLSTLEMTDRAVEMTVTWQALSVCCVCGVCVCVWLPSASRQDTCHHCYMHFSKSSRMTWLH